jgi:hypothetical protein
MKRFGILWCVALAMAPVGEVRASAPASMPSRTDVERFSAAVRLVSAGPSGATTSSEKVARTPGGQRYHRVGCRSALGQVRLLSRQEAEAAGLEACRRCLVPRVARPPRADPHGAPPAREAAPEPTGDAARPWERPDGAARRAGPFP